MCIRDRAKSVGVEGAFQRVESLVAAVWSFSDLILLAGLLQGMKRIVGVLLPKASPHLSLIHIFGVLVHEGVHPLKKLRGGDRQGNGVVPLIGNVLELSLIHI